VNAAVSVNISVNPAVSVNVSVTAPMTISPIAAPSHRSPPLTSR
jgi:hypothetical protein